MRNNGPKPVKKMTTHQKDALIAVLSIGAIVREMKKQGTGNISEQENKRKSR